MEKQDPKELHIKAVEQIKKRLSAWKDPKGSSPTEVKINSSHMMRQKKYEQAAPQLGMDVLNHILEINSETQTARIEPYVTQEQLIDKTLALGLIPPVVAEFKKITWGGAVMGASLESSSHKFGQVNDVMLGYEILLGNGDVIKASPTENSDLFWGVSGSYGSFGRILSLEVPLIKAKKYVSIEVKKFTSVVEGIDYMRHLIRSSQCPDYVEALVYSKNDFKVILGSLTDEESLPLVEMSSGSSLWFYQLIQKHKESFRLLIKDYLFRYDRGAFWMGSYAHYASLLTRFAFENSPFFPDFALDYLKNYKAGKYNVLQYPSFFLRTIAGWYMDSHTLYSWLHFKKEDWFKKNFIVQDFYLPEDKSAEFINDSLDKQDIKPIWICPCKSSQNPQFLSPHFQTTGLLFDIGIYGWPSEKSHAEEATKNLEESCYRLGGKKMFYSWNFMDKEFIWSHYSKSDYEQLRETYHANRVFPGFINKIL